MSRPAPPPTFLPSLLSPLPLTLLTGVSAGESSEAAVAQAAFLPSPLAGPSAAVELPLPQACSPRAGAASRVPDGLAAEGGVLASFLASLGGAPRRENTLARCGFVSTAELPTSGVEGVPSTGLLGSGADGDGPAAVSTVTSAVGAAAGEAGSAGLLRPPFLRKDPMSPEERLLWRTPAADASGVPPVEWSESLLCKEPGWRAAAAGEGAASASGPLLASPPLGFPQEAASLGSSSPERSTDASLSAPAAEEDASRPSCVSCCPLSSTVAVCSGSNSGPGISSAGAAASRLLPLSFDSPRSSAVTVGDEEERSFDDCAAEEEEA